jgi:hypothetical protein
LRRLRRGPKKLKITVHDLRHIFVTDRQSDPSAPGPSMESAARGMLHSSRMWLSGPYDLGRERRQVEERAADMAQYRQHKLQRLESRRGGAAGAAEPGSEDEVEEGEGGPSDH